MRGMVVDIRINEIAASQHGVVSRAQLIDADVSAASVDRRISARLLQPVHRGVYRVGPGTRAFAREMAAVLACEGKVVISHVSAVGLQRLLSVAEAAEPVHVIAKNTAHGRKRNILVHRCGSLRNTEITRCEGIPVTTPARTLLDYAGMVAGDERGSRARRTEVAGARRNDVAVARRTIVTILDVDRAVNEAFARRLTTRDALLRILAVHLRARGARVLRDILQGRTGATRSAAERRLLTLLRKAELPLPEVNATFDGIEVDFLWRDRGLAVEVDGFAFHSTADRFENDRRRGNRLVAAGLRVTRLTWRQLTKESEATIARITQALFVPHAGVAHHG